MDLATLWFVILGVLLTGYAILDGFDLGVGILYPLVRGETERRLALNSIGPLWDGTGWYDDQWVKTNSGWQIARRSCRVIWFTGNPAVKETIPGVSFDTVLDTLRGEGREGRLDFLTAIS